MSIAENKSFRRRFVKDYNLPINLVDSPYFEYYMDRYDFFPKNQFNKCVDNINSNFDGDVNKWLEYYSTIRDKIITSIENSCSYKNFNSFDIKQYQVTNLSVGDYNIYNNSNTGKYFISLDLKKANFQALKWFDKDIVFNSNSYEELIDYFGGDDYFKESKYTRQVIFGKLNPKRTIQLEKYLICEILNNTKNEHIQYLKDKTTLVTIKSDEIIFSFNEDMLNAINDRFLSETVNEIYRNHGLNVTLNAFKLYRLVCENHNGNTIDGYVRYFYLSGVEDLKSVSSIFFPQVYAFSKNLDLTDNDLYFRAEEQMAKFIYPLEFIKKEG